jgi:hypothetical protein
MGPLFALEQLRWSVPLFALAVLASVAWFVLAASGNSQRPSPRARVGRRPWLDLAIGRHVAPEPGVAAGAYQYS